MLPFWPPSVGNGATGRQWQASPYSLGPWHYHRASVRIEAVTFARDNSMKCETCEREFQQTAVKVWEGKKVCPSCFDTLTASSASPSERHFEVVHTRQVVTTVCPDCNAEIHRDSRKCPYCGAFVRRVDRGVRAVGGAVSATGNFVVLFIGVGSCILILMAIALTCGYIARWAAGLVAPPHWKKTELFMAWAGVCGGVLATLLSIRILLPGFKRFMDDPLGRKRR